MNKLFLGFIIFLIMGVGVAVFMTADKYDNGNYWISGGVLGGYLILAGVGWAISLFLYKRYSDGNMLIAILWFGPLFRFMFDILMICVAFLIGK